MAGRRSRIIAGRLATAALLAWCAAGTPTAAQVAAPQPVPSAAAVATHPCNSQAVTSCLLPFPSGQYLTVDPTTATGYRVTIPPDILGPDILGQFGAGAALSDMTDGADGFSVVTPIFFELPDQVDPASLPADGGDVVRVTDLSTGKRVPVRVELSAEAAQRWATDRVVAVWPVTAFPAATRFLAVVTDGLRSVDGAPVRRAPGMDPTTAATRLDSARVGRMALQAAAVDPTLDWGHVVTATSFVTRSVTNVTAEVDRMATIIRAEDHPVRNIWVSPSVVTGTTTVTGQIRVTDFRDPDGVIHSGESLGHTTEWVDFLMLVPDHPAGGGRAPLVIYGHGLSVSKETMLAVAGTNAEKGLATIGIDIPNHGSRITEGGFLTENATPWRFGRLASMPLQGELDHLSLLMAIRQHFASIDIAPVNWLGSTWGDGRGDLDPRHVIYEGTSMGGFLGAEFVALAPELDGAFLQVAGSGVIDTLFHSALWPFFRTIEPWGATAGDAHALVGIAAVGIDRSDNTYFIDRVARNRTPFYLVYADGDGIVPNTSSERMARIMGLPLVGERYHEVPGLATVAALPADGTGASQVPTADLDGNWAKPLLAHTWFGTPRPMGELTAWLDQRIAAMSPGSVPAGS